MWLPVSRCRRHCRVPVERGRRKHSFADGAHVHADCARQHGSASATLVHAAPRPLQPDVYFDYVLLMTCFSLLLYFQMLYFNLSLSLCQLYWHRRCHDALHIRVQPVEGSIELMLRVARSSIVAAATDIIGGGCSSTAEVTLLRNSMPWPTISESTLEVTAHVSPLLCTTAASFAATESVLQCLFFDHLLYARPYPVSRHRPRLLRRFKFHMRVSLSLRYCCCGPMTLPGRTFLSQPMASLAVNP